MNCSPWIIFFESLEGKQRFLQSKGLRDTRTSGSSGRRRRVSAPASMSQGDTIDVVGGMCPLFLLSQSLHESILSTDHIVIGSIALSGSRARMGAGSAALALATAAGHVAGGGVGQLQGDSVVDVERLTARVGSRAGSEAVGKGHEGASTRRGDVLGIGSGSGSGWVFDVDLGDLGQGRLFVGTSSTLTLVGVEAEVDGVL